jgi:hypothetical protein
MGLAASTDNTGLRPISFKAQARTSLACARCGTHHLLRIHHTFLAWRGILSSFHSQCDDVAHTAVLVLVKKRDAEHRRGTTWSWRVCRRSALWRDGLGFNFQLG